MNQPETSLLAAAWRHRWLVVVVTAFVLAVALIVDLLGPDVETFEATSSIVIQEPVASVEATQTGSSLQYMRSQLEIMRSPVVSEAATAIASEAGVDVLADDLAAAAVIVGTPDSPLVLITARAASPDAAVLYSNAMAEGYRQVSQRQASATSEAQLARLDAQVDAIDDRLTEIEVELGSLFADNPSLELLEAQANEAVGEIATIQVRLLTAEGEEADLLRLRLLDHRQTIAVYQEILDAASAGPEPQALIREQGLQVDRRARLLTLRDEIAVDASIVPDSVALVQPAAFAERVGGLGLMRTLVGALMVGLAMGVALAYFLSMSRRTFTLRSEPETILGVPMLADVPDFGQEGLESTMPVRDYPRSAAAEAYRFAAASMEARARDRDARVVFVASSTLGHGKTTTVVNTAMAAAFQGRSVLVMDCDFGSQQAARQLVGSSHSSIPGITDVVGGVMSARSAVHRVDLGDGVVVSLLSRGTRPGLAGTTLQSTAAAHLVAEMREEYEIVLIDGPPLLQVAYASSLAKLADGLVVVIEHQGRHSQAEDLNAMLELIGTPVLGYVYNRSPLRREMTMTEGSMMDILGDSGFDADIEIAPSQRRG